MTDVCSLKTRMPDTCYGAQSASVVNGKIYVTGRRMYQGAHIGLDVNYKYDPATDSWATKAPMHTRHMYHNSVSYNEKMYVMGGKLQFRCIRLRVLQHKLCI